MTTLITGSRGRIARALTALLLAEGHPVRTASRSPERLPAPDGVPVTHLNLADPTGFPAALTGVTSVFLYAEATHITAFLAAAQAAGVEHIVLLSTSAVLAPGAGRDPLARHHVEVESALAASPLTTTVLRPGTFASNALQWSWPVKTSGAVELPYPGAYTDPVHEADLAAAAFATLTDPTLRGGAYHLTGPESLTFTDQIAMLAQATGRQIRTVPVDRAAWKAQTAGHMPEPFTDALLDWWKAHDGSPTELTDTLERLTGRPPRTFAEWAAEHAGAFINQGR